jgi:hypothetical protein
VTRDELPDHVQATIARHIESIQQVEILALIRGEPDRPWTTADICRSLHVSPVACEVWIDRFAATGVVSRDQDEDAVRYAPHADNRRAFDDLVELYTRRRHSVIDSIYSKP